MRRRIYTDLVALARKDGPTIATALLGTAKKVIRALRGELDNSVAGERNDTLRLVPP